MQTLAIDIETYCERDLSKTGVYAYCEHPSFQVLLFAYAFDNQDVKVIDLAVAHHLPKEVIDALNDPRVTKTAFNANFERVCLSSYFNLDLPANQWECTMVKAGMAGLPMSLAMASTALNLPQGKIAEGKALIRYFCMPCKPTKANGGRERNIAIHDPAKWELFKEYCKRDVEVEREVRRHLDFLTIPKQEKELYHLDQKINDRGIKLDPNLIRGAITINNLHATKLMNEAKEVTALENPNSERQLKEWLTKELGQSVDSLTKADTTKLIEQTDNLQAIKALELRQDLSKTSIKKYDVMHECSNGDWRARGLLQFYGASRTGRWAGRLIQVQNLPQNHLPDLDLARELVATNEYETLKLLFANIPNVLSQLVRTAFVAKEGHTFIIADYSAIEARVIAWLANEAWRLDVFATHGKIYEASAAAMFGVQIDEVTKDMRQKGKVAELALGYQGGVGALLSMGAISMGLKEEELPALVKAWRCANRQIVKLWQQVGLAALQALEHRTTVKLDRNISFSYDTHSDALFITLPSGRQLCYQQPQIGINRFGSKALKYLGMNQVTKKWEPQETYGGKLVENITQAVARDCLACGMQFLDTAGYKIVMHVHDEVVIEIKEEKAAQGLKEVCDLLCKRTDWQTGLVLKAEGYITHYYKKD